MKVLMLAPQPFYVSRGTPIAVRACAQTLGQLGHEVVLLTYFEGHDVAMPGVTLRRIARPPMVRRVPIGVSWQKVPCDVVMYRQAAGMLAAGGYGVIHGVEEGGFLARWLSKRFDVPYVYDMDSMMSAQIVERSRLLAPLGAVFRKLERDAIRDSAGVLAVCPALVDYAKRHHPDGNVALLPDLPVHVSNGGGGADPCGFGQMPGLTLLYVGNLEAYQGISLLLNAFAIRARNHQDATLVFVGGRDKHIAAYKRKAGRLAESGQVQFLGPRPLEMLPSILSAADILASPRVKGINTPMKVYNYMESARPILATDMLTHRQVLDESTAMLVAPQPVEMAAGLGRLLEDPALRVRLGEAARARLRQEYSSQRYRQRLAAFYDMFSPT